MQKYCLLHLFYYFILNKKETEATIFIFLRLYIKTQPLLINNDLNIIIKGCIDQNRRSQQEFYKTFYGYSAAICMRYTQKNEDLVEIVNDGFVKIFKELEFFRVPKENFDAILRSWIKKIMVNTSIDYYRKYVRGEQKTVDIDGSTESFEVQAETPLDKMTYEEIIKIFVHLTPMYKMVFNMYVIDGFSHDEIAKELGITVGTSKSNLSKARANITRLIENKQKTAV